MLSIEFTASPNDFAAVQRYFATRVRRTLIDRFGLNSLYLAGYACGIFGVIDTTVRLMRLRDIHWSIILAPQVMTAIGFLALVVWSYARQAVVKRALARLQRTRPLAVTIRATPTEVSVELPDRAITYRWAAISEIETIRGFTLLYTGIDVAEFVPDAAFDGEDSRRRFVQSAREWRADAIGIARSHS